MKKIFLLLSLMVCGAHAHKITNDFGYPIKAIAMEGRPWVTKRVTTHIMPGETKTLEVGSDMGTYQIIIERYGRASSKNMTCTIANTYTPNSRRNCKHSFSHFNPKVMARFEFPRTNQQGLYHITIRPDGFVEKRPLNEAAQKNIAQNIEKRPLDQNGLIQRI